MTTLCELSQDDRLHRLRGDGLPLQVGPYTYRIRSNLRVVAQGIDLLYQDFPVASPKQFIDFDITVSHRGVWQRLRKRSEFLFEEQSPFDSLPAHQAFAFLEWGMNWCVSLYTNEHLKLHAAVVAKDRRAIVMPGIPGAGKSTLCAALGLSGWRILSDEHALVPLGSFDVIPLCRPVSLKNESIQVIQQRAPNATFGPLSKETHKGLVAHLKADLQPDSHNTSALPISTLVFPRFSEEAEQHLSPRPRSSSFLIAAYHAFNYSLLGKRGFQAMRDLIDNVECYDLVYHNLDWAIEQIDSLHKDKPA
ncbi:MAG: HprK-related kinase A [Pseudomonadota bacterium]